MGKRARKDRSALDPNQFVSVICQRLSQNQRVRRTLPGWGRVHIDRQLPFLCAYRRQPQHEALQFHHLVTSEASYLYGLADRGHQPLLRTLVDGVEAEMMKSFGAFLHLELWPGWVDESADQPELVAKPIPRFRLLVPERNDLGGYVDKFVESLARIKINGQSAEVNFNFTRRAVPPGLQPLASAEQIDGNPCVTLGLIVRPIYVNHATGEVFPQLRRQLERGLSVALKRAFFEFVRTATTHRPPHYHALGRRAMVQAVWRADRRLAEVADQFDFLLQVSPINGAAAWKKFQKIKYVRAPVFHYRPLPIDPVVLKRKLYDTPVERVEDPAIGQLLRDKLNELDRQITLLQDINTPRFLHGSVQLYGLIDIALLNLSEGILKSFPTNDHVSDSETLNASEFAERARAEVQYLRAQDERVAAKVQVRDDITGLIVSQGSLLVGADVAIPKHRVDALLQHEVGTHILTYYNGRSQPFRQLYAGLSGYEALQEGIAVLAEHLVGGLTRNRLRLLAARVIVSQMLVNGESFVECFQRLVDQYQFPPRSAFTITMRVFRGGGLTKDAIYLRGLMQAVKYVANGDPLDPLLVGKIAANHIPMIRELQWRKVLHEPRLIPRFMTDSRARERIEKIRQGRTVIDLVEG